MQAQLINGKEIAIEMKETLKLEVQQLISQGIRPGLAVVLVGEDPGSQIYVRNKANECEKLGIYSEVIRIPETTTDLELLELIHKLNQNTDIHGILVQSPLPAHISEKAIVNAIDAAKDVDCFHPENVGNLMIGDKGILPCTPAGIIEMLKVSGIEMAGKQAVVIGRSNIVGKPIAMLLLRENATVTICHSKTVDMKQITRQADIVIAAVGRAHFITEDYIKPGAVVIDVGINRLENGKVVGDVDMESVKRVAGYVSPVPGGVGPMTITMLLKNTLEAAKHTLSKRV
ncbi:MAG TPA: bifunctional methylenetetrahydrofolate dehydrogenase/methenyltetrahydrofolate cyclohydrolase FolD [Bacilli bacterium]